ncbi:hypothetical protein BX661DRAFT_10682 [Kickxella alabastrina]|uniref:uncharacterized protein n=1 Tax=Kickxella alabastrina TaxID=61397 RepID=UPI00221EF1AE|nr:uncharacterized protein BX661DRAFT_10682 [Kickxella alabastrina]KAI7835093.1 hypothetical protein BX661DRAFT_10682 [Kickxella alabastrina]
MSYFYTADNPYWPCTLVELMRAKEVLEACDFVSTSTKGCYSSRIALWMHYCAQRCGGDERVTEERLADYVEWMVTSGSAERIRQGSTHVQQVLRNQLQGVLCYWRLQNGNRADLPDPRVGHIFMSKWQQIVMRFPRPRQSRRSEPIYGVPKGSSGSESTDEYGAVHPNGTPPISLRPTFGVIGNGVIHPIGQPGQVLGSSQAIHRHRYPTVRPEYTQTHSYRSNSPLYPHENIDNSYRPCSPVYPQGHISQQQHHQHQNQQHSQQQNQQQQQGRLLKTLQRPNQLPVPINSRMSPPETLEAIPIVKYVSKPSYPTSGQQFSLSQAPLQVAPLNADVSSSTRAGSRFSPTTDDEGRHSVTDQDSNKLKLLQPASPSVSRSPQIDTDETMVPGSPNMDVETEKLLGVVPEVIPKWQKNDESLTEGNLLTLKESIVLNARQLEMGSNAQSQARTHRCLGISTWMSSGARTNLTLTDVSMDEALNTATTPQQAIVGIPTSGDKTTHVDKPFSKCIAVTVHHSAKNTLAGLKPGKAAIMRHANPLLCSWNALSFELFRRWHVANEAIPDFATAEWQSLKLFPTLSDGAELPMEVDQVTRIAFAGISKDM